MSVVTISSFGFTGFRLDDLQRQVTRIQAFALSDNTKRNYRSVWNTYSKFCRFYSITPFPASASTVAAFIVLLSFSVKSHHTINNYLSALRRLHVFCHFDTSGFDDIHVKLTQKGLEKSMVHLPHRKAPLTLGILLQVTATSTFAILPILLSGAPFSSVSSLSSGRPIWFLALWTVSHLIKSYSGAASSSPVLPLLSQLHVPKLVRQGTLLSLFQYLTSPDLLSAPQQPSNLYLLPFQPLIVLRSSPSLHLRVSSTVSQQHPSTMALNIWFPCCLLIPLISLVIVCVGVVLHLPSSAEYHLSSSNSKAIGDLMPTCFI